MKIVLLPLLLGWMVVACGPDRPEGRAAAPALPQDELAYWRERTRSPEAGAAKARAMRALAGLAAARGLAEDVPFASLLADWRAENLRRDSVLAAGGTLYGPARLPRDAFLDGHYRRLEAALKPRIAEESGACGEGALRLRSVREGEMRRERDTLLLALGGAASGSGPDTVALHGGTWRRLSEELGGAFAALAALRPGDSLAWRDGTGPRSARCLARRPGGLPSFEALRPLLRARCQEEVLAARLAVETAAMGSPAGYPAPGPAAAGPSSPAIPSLPSRIER